MPGAVPAAGTMGGPAAGMFDGQAPAIPRRSRWEAAFRRRYIPSGRCPTPSGYIPGAPIIATPALGEGLARLQAGETGFDLAAAPSSSSPGIPQGTHNVLRDLQESPLGKKANQLESMTIELVAMLFDFIFETKDLPDGIKALLARLQIPVLKAAMLDGAFFAKKAHPSRLLVNALAEAGLGWSPVMGQDDPLYKKIDAIVHRILDGFTDNLAIFDELREDLEAFLAEEEKAAEATSRRPPRRSTRATGSRSPVGRASRRSSGASSSTRSRISWRRSFASIGSGRSSISTCTGRGERGVGTGGRDARGPRLERAAEEDERGSPAPGGAAAIAPEADVRRACRA